jgi:hypothetical protein
LNVADITAENAQVPDHVAHQIEEEDIPSYHEQLTEEEL